jgi:hypothetical protein
VTETIRELVLGRVRAVRRELERVVQQPETLRRRAMQILGHALAVGQIGDRQTAADRERQDAAKRGRLVELRDDQRLRARGLEDLGGFGEARAIGAGR